MLNSTNTELYFKLELRATRIPLRGWDKLMVSMISVETGKVTTTTPKASVKNGSCQWSELLHESASLPRQINGKHASKELYKLVVSMSRSRSGILGEATINMAEYTRALRPVIVSLPLHNCRSGTILHVTLQRVTANVAANRDLEEQKEMASDGLARSSIIEGRQSENAVNPVIVAKDDFVPPTPGVSESRIRPREWIADELISPSSSISSSHESNSFQYYVGMDNIDSKGLPSSDDNQDEPQITNDWGSHKTLEGLEKFEANVKELRPECASTDVTSTKMEEELHILRKKLSEEISKNEILEKQLSTLSKEQELMDEKALHKQLENQKSLNSNLSLELRKTQEVNSELILGIQELGKLLKGKTESVVDTNLVHGSDIMGFERENGALGNMVDAVKRDLAELKSHSKELATENRNLISMLRLEKDKVKAQEISISQLEDTVAELESVVSQPEMNITIKGNQSGKYRGERMGEIVNEMRDKSRDGEDSYEGKVDGNQTICDDLNSNDIGFEREIQSLDGHQSTLLAEIEILKKENNAQKEEIQCFQQQTSGFLNEIKSLRKENNGYESVITSQKGQLKRLREKTMKAEEDYMNALKQIEELKTLNRSTFTEDEDYTVLNKQLEDTQEYLLSTESKYKKMLQLTTCIKAENSTLLEAKREAEFTITQLKSLNASVQEKLHMEELKILELQQQHEHDEDKLSVLIDEMTQMKLLEQGMVTHEKEMEKKVHDLHEENKTHKKRIEELESEIESGSNLRNHLKETISELEIQILDLQNQIQKLPDKVNKLEKDEMDYEKHYKDDATEKDSLQEVESFRNETAARSQREMELLAKLSVQEALQSELENVKREKQELEDALSIFNAGASNDNSVKRIATLELELAEILEANNMYKKQLQSAFSQQQIVHVAALENLGSVEQVLQDLADLKRKNSILDDELRDMKERYLNMSLQFAEVEAEREQLVMTLRTRQGARKLLPYKSANF